MHHLKRFVGLACLLPRLPLPTPTPPVRDILGCRIRVLERDQAIATILSAVEARTSLRVAFVNAHLATIAARDPDVADTLSQFLLLNDGAGIDLASRLLYGTSFPANLDGTDFTPALLDTARPGLRLYLLGARADVIAAAASVYARRWPQHVVVGVHDGFFAPEDEPALAAAIRASAPDLILVGMGCPRQELWLARHDVAPVALAVGALFDFQSGRIARAPLWMRLIRLEWVYRLALEPRRLWRRYLPGNAAFLARVLRQKAGRD